MTHPRQAARYGRDPHDASGEAPETVRVRLLGGFRVSVGARSVKQSDWRLKKAGSLVKLLALEPGHRLHRERIMEVLWPELDAKIQANNLRQVLHDARRTLEPSRVTGSRYLRREDEQLALYPGGPLRVDVDAFEEAAATARRSREPAAYRTAIDLYAGELLPNDPYEHWAEDRREVLRRTYLSLLAELAGLHEEREEHGLAIEALERVVAEEPAHEGAHAGLMRLYAASGQRGRALKQYERLGEALGELDAEPDAVARRLHEEIVAGRFPWAPSSPPTDPPPEKTAGGDKHNLPAARSTLVGREREMLEVKRMLAMTRLLTLTGAGGCGKTRLALEVAHDLAGTYPDGVWLVELAGLLDPALVPQAVADALGVREQPNRPLVDVLVDVLRDTRMLLVLDNCEHLIHACAQLAETLLGACPGLRILATSREALSVAGEMNWVVPSLSVPDANQAPSVEELAEFGAARLFVERASYRSSAFALTPENAGAVAEICRKLDGIPLAVELAAARVGLPVEQIAARLDDSLGLLTGGNRTATPRQKTLRGALDWSHELLGGPEKRLFRWLSVLAGGWTMEAAEAVGAEPGDGAGRSDVLDLTLRLVDKSLVVAEASGDGGVRYRMLEPVHQYAREKLEAAAEKALSPGEAETVRRRHAGFFLALAEEAEPELRGGRQGEWAEWLDREHDNLRAALSWALESGETELSLRLGGALGWFWRMRGHLGEGRHWLEAVLANGGGSPSARAKALLNAGHLAWEQFEYARATAYSEEALELARALGDTASVATALYNLGTVAMFEGEHDRASALLEEATALQRELGDKAGLAWTLQLLGLVEVVRHDFELAAALHEEGLPLAREAEDKLGEVILLGMGALAFLGMNDHERVKDYCAKAMELSRQLKHAHGTAFILHVLAALAGSRGRSVHSARLWGAAEMLRETIGIGDLSTLERRYYGPYIAAAREGLDEAAWEAAWAEGKAMTTEEAVEYALSEKDEPAIPAVTMLEQSPTGTRSPALTRREEEVAVLVARGLTNRQVAGELSISERTVENHVSNTLKKLELPSRSGIALWVAERRRSSSSGPV